MFLDVNEQKAAQEKMITLNLAYEEALRLAVPHRSAAYTQALPQQDAIHLARKMIRQQNPESALRQLMRAETKDAVWYHLQGQIFMLLEQFESANQSFREAIRRDPDNLEYRRGALDAVVAMRESKTVSGRIKRLLHRKK